MFLTGVRQWGVQHRLGLVAAPFGYARGHAEI